MHVPVLFNETLEYLITDPRGVYVDCTVGGGGHLQGIIARTGEEAVLIGIDQDGEILEKTRTRMSGHANVILAKGISAICRLFCMDFPLLQPMGY